MKTAQNNSCGWKIAQNYWFMSRNNEQYKRKVQRKLGHLVKILVSRFPFDVNGKLNFPNISIFFHAEKRTKKYFPTQIYFVCYRFNIVSFFALRAQNDGQFSMFLN